MNNGRFPARADQPNPEVLNSSPHVYFRRLGRRLTQLRKDRELTQAEVGRALGITQQSVFLIELGDRRLRVDWVPTLAKLFGISADDLLGISSEPPPMPTRDIRGPDATGGEHQPS